MPAVGRKPKPEDQRRNRVQPVHNWIDVQDVPYEGPVPDPGRLPARTKHWWAVISRMPHCILWDDAHWQYAIDAAWLHSLWVNSKKVGYATELRQREKVMGTTEDARRDLRIRYVPVGVAEEAEQPTAIDDYRQQLA